MSRIGKKPVPIPSGVKVNVSGHDLKVAGPKGELKWTAPAPVTVAVDGAEVVITRSDDQPQSRALHGLTRALIANMIEGVSTGYAIKLEVYGTGYSAKKQGKQLWLNCGYMGLGHGKSAQFMLDIPSDLDVQVEVENARGESDPARFTIKGIDKQKVGQFAAEIRKLRKPEPYKGKGIRYAGERVRRKAGKVFASGGA